MDTGRAGSSGHVDLRPSQYARRRRDAGTGPRGGLGWRQRRPHVVTRALQRRDVPLFAARGVWEVVRDPGGSRAKRGGAGRIRRRWRGRVEIAGRRHGAASWPRRWRRTFLGARSGSQQADRTRLRGPHDGPDPRQVPRASGRDRGQRRRRRVGMARWTLVGEQRSADVRLRRSERERPACSRQRHRLRLRGRRRGFCSFGRTIRHREMAGRRSRGRPGRRRGGTLCPASSVR